MFGGLDVAVLKSTLDAEASVEANPTYKRFWAPTPEARRSRAAAVLLGHVDARRRSIAGNRALGSDVHVTNQLWFSYPGYSELLVGAAHDDVIKSNDATRNPYPTVLEFLRRKLGHRRMASDCSRPGVSSAPSANRDREPSRSMPGYERYDHPDPAIARSATGSSKHRHRGTACDTMSTRSSSRWPTSRRTGRASCTSRSARPTTGRTMAGTIGCSTPTRDPIAI